MTDFPDVYADGVQIAAGAYGLTLTFLLTQPTQETGARAAQVSTNPVARVRISPQMAEYISKVLADALANLPTADVPSFADIQAVTASPGSPGSGGPLPSER